MSRLTQNHIEHIMDLVSRGKMGAAQGNVELVKIARVKLITSRVPAEVRAALNAAVKRGELAHIKKDGKKPEAYYHPEFEHLLKEDRARHEQRVINAVAAVCCRSDA